MTAEERPATLTVSLPDPASYVALQQAADERSISVEMMVAEAVREWLERRELDEDLMAIDEVEGEETVPWEEVRAEMREARMNQRARWRVSARRHENGAQGTAGAATQNQPAG